MTIDALIAEITSGGFAQYEESGLIDYLSLRRWIKSELKRFGSNLMVMNETILHVKNNKAKVPENFWQMYLAVNCEMQGYTTEDSEDVLQNSLFFKERIEGTQEWDNMSDSYVGKDFKYVREDFVFKNSKATFYYSNPKFLKLNKGFNKSVCAPGCQNLRSLLVDQSPNSIDIVGEQLNANFKVGDIYMQFRGLAADEEGKILIPTTQHNRLVDYLIYYCRMRILEDIWTGQDGDVANQISYFDRKRADSFMLAMTEIKMEGLGKGWTAKIRNKQRAQTLKYDVMLPRV